MNKKTVILGASTNPSRYSYIAANRLVNAGHEIIPLGVKKGAVAEQEIVNEPFPTLDDIDTLTLYLNPNRQEQYYDYILSLRPKRIIFNPGTENAVLASKARAVGIETINACTLVMLSTHQY